LSSKAVWLLRVLMITGGIQLLFCCTLAGVGSSSRDTASASKPRNVSFGKPCPIADVRFA
jgi:hypothetical protein